MHVLWPRSDLQNNDRLSFCAVFLSLLADSAIVLKATSSLCVPGCPVILGIPLIEVTFILSF